MIRTEPPLPRWQSPSLPFTQDTWLAILVSVLLLAPVTYLLARAATAIPRYCQLPINSHTLPVIINCYTVSINVNISINITSIVLSTVVPSGMTVTVVIVKPGSLLHCGMWSVPSCTPWVSTCRSRNPSDCTATALGSSWPFPSSTPSSWTSPTPATSLPSSQSPGDPRA